MTRINTSRIIAAVTNKKTRWNFFQAVFQHKSYSMSISRLSLIAKRAVSSLKLARLPFPTDRREANAHFAPESFAHRAISFFPRIVIHDGGNILLRHPIGFGEHALACLTRFIGTTNLPYLSPGDFGEVMPLASGHSRLFGARLFLRLCGLVDNFFRGLTNH